VDIIVVDKASGDVPIGDAGPLQGLPEELRRPPQGVAPAVISQVEKLFYYRNAHGRTFNEVFFYCIKIDIYRFNHLITHFYYCTGCEKQTGKQSGKCKGERWYVTMRHQS
jgi:hypothetical protein